MKKSTLIKLAAMLGILAGSAAQSQVFNMQDIQQGFADNGYNYAHYGQGAYTDTGNNIWNGFDNGQSPGSGDSFGGGNNYTDPLTTTPGNPYAHSTDGYWAPDSGIPTTPVLFSPSDPGNTSAGNSWSDGTLSPITVPQLISGLDSGTTLPLTARTTPSWIFSVAAVVNTGNPAWGSSVPPYAPLGLCVLSNVPPGTNYSLYLYGANFDGTRGASFVVSNTGTPLNGIFQTMNPNTASGSGPLTNFVLGQNYVVYNNVTPDASGRITITWGAVSNVNSGLSGEGDFDALQLVASSVNPTSPAVIVQEPFNSIFNAGATATLFADGRGNPAPVFQWYGPLGLVPGQTNSTLTLPDFQSSESGNYYCVVSNTDFAVTSSVATLTLDTTNAIDIVAQSPSNGVSVAAGFALNESLSLSVLGAEPITYYWESNGTVIDVISNGTISAVPDGSSTQFGSSSSVTVTNITASCVLSCVVSNSSGAVTNIPIAVTIAPTPTNSYGSAVLALHPIGYWPLNETNGTTAVNFGSFGPAANGVYSAVAACPLQQGVAGPPVIGMGPNDFGTQFSVNNSQDNNDTQTGVVINDADLDTASDHDITVAMWVEQPTSGSYGIQEVYGQADSTLIRFSVFGTDNAQMDFVDGGNDIIGGPLIDDGNWHFWTGTFTASNNLVVTYLDGQQIASGTENTPGTSTDPTVIGGSPDDTGRNFIGSVCQVAVIPSVLTDAQVEALYSSVGVAPAILLNPPATVVANAGTSATLGPVDASGSESLSLNWYVGTPGSGSLLTNGNRISGANSGNLVINPVAGSDQNFYYFVASNAFGTATSGVLTLIVPTTNNTRVFAGQSPTFSVSAGDGPFASYQWSTNGTPVVGATNHTFTLANLQAGNNGETVSCAISDPSFTGTVNGSVQTLTIVPAPSDSYAQAVLTDHPIAYYRLDEANIYGDNGNGDDGSPAFDYISGNNGTYTNVILNTNVTGDPYGVQLLDTDGDTSFGTFATANSFAGFIPGIDFGLAPSNSPAQPGNAEFSVEAWVQGMQGGNHGIVTKGYGGGNQATPNGEQFSLQESEGGGNFAFVVDDGLTNKDYVYAPNDALWHHLVGVCDQANGKLLLYVDGQLSANASSTITPGNGLLSSAVPVSIGAKQSADSSGNYNAQWVGDIDEVAIYNYALSASQVDAHYIAAGVPPSIVTAPLANITADADTTTNFSVVVLGTLPLSYQWSGPDGAIAGATNATLTLVNVNSADSPPNTGPGAYTCVITNLYGTNTVTGNLNVQSGPPQIVQDLAPDTFAVAGGTAVFSVGVQGTSPFTNYWYQNGVLLANGGRVSGATTGTLMIANVQASDAGNYQLLVTNAPGNGHSSVSTLVVDSEPLFDTNGGGWTANGGVASVSGDVLTITTESSSEATSFFFDTPMYIGAFQTKFTYQYDGTTSPYPADGFGFCLQNDPRGPAALGGGAGGVGLSGITPSADISIELFPQVGSVGWQYLTNGATATSYNPPDPISLSSGDPIDWTIAYDGNSITLTMSDEVTKRSYNTNFTVGSLPAIVGGDTAYIGFGGGTGGYEALQTITNFTYVPLPLLSATNGSGSVAVTWPAGIGGYGLQTSSSLTNWTAVPGPFTTNASGQYQYGVSSPTGNQFYRLVVP